MYTKLLCEVWEWCAVYVHDVHVNLTYDSLPWIVGLELHVVKACWDPACYSNTIA